MHIEAILIAIKLLSKCGFFWDQMAAEVEAFHLHLVTTTYGEAVLSAGGAEIWTLVLTMVRVIWRELRKLQVELETAYGSGDNLVMVGQYLMGTLQAHRVTDEFLRAQFQQHPEMAPHITPYLFEHRSPRLEVAALKQKVESQANTISLMEKTCKELRSRADSFTDQSNCLGKK